MIPSKKEWGEWSSSERASYVAQILVPISLMVTVVFSFMSWREARLSQRMQLQLFQAQNSPALDVSQVRFPKQAGPKKLFVMALANTGSSVAKDVCVSATFIPAISMDESPVILSSCNDEPTREVTIEPGATSGIPLFFPADELSAIGIDPAQASVINLLKDAEGCEANMIATLAAITVSFKDAFENRSSLFETLYVCGKRLSVDEEPANTRRLNATIPERET